MHCSKCGMEYSEGAAFCPGCGAKIDSQAPYYAATSVGPKEPSTIGPFILGMLLGIIGVIIAIVVYNGNDGPYTKDPTKHALIWSLIGMFIWIPVVIVMVTAFVLSGI